MSDLPDELPSDPAELRAFAAALLERCARLERLLKLAKDAQFGRSSEKLDADQLQLVLEDIDGAVAALEAAEDRADPKTGELPSAGPIVASCRSICHASSKSCCRPKPIARAARVSFLRLGAMRARGWTSCRRSIV